jgi:tetratricopeptide (TPR) repeat protein
MRPSLLPILAGLLVSAVPALADTAPASHTGAAAPVQLDQRAAIHAGYARLVFAGIKGAAAVPFRAGAENGTLTVRFQQPVRFALAPLEKGLAGYATHLALSPDGLTLTASLTKSVEVRQAVADPTTLVVDLVAVPKPAQAARVQAPKPPASRQTAAAAPKPVPAVPLRMRIASSASLDRLSFGLPRHIDFHASETANPGPVNRATIAFDRPVRLNVDRLNTQLPQALRPFTLADDGSSFSFALPAGRHLQTDRQGSRVTVTIGPAAPGPGVMVIAPPPPPPPPPPPKPALVPVKVAKAPVVPPPPTLPPQIGLEAIAPPSGVLGGGSDLRLFWTQTDDGLSLRFDWHDPVSAAVFRRGPAIWIVFDRAASLDLSQFEAQNLPVLTAIQRVPTDTGMALRLTVWNGFNASVRRAGSAWLIDLKNEPQRADAPVMPDFQNAGTGAALVFPALDPAGPVRLTDPDAGDTLIAVPLPQLGQGVQDPIEIPDIVTLASAQGLAFRPISDQLSIQSDPADVAISSVDGLTFSSFLDRRALPHQTAEGADLFHFADWVGPASRDFTQQRLFLQNAIQAAPEADRDAARLDLAKFYIANAMGAEALGVLAAIQRESPEAFDEPLLRALRGVAENLMNRNPAAVADFADKNLDGRKDAVLWRGAIAADQGDWTAAAADYEKAKDLLPSYPARLRRRLDLKFAEALVDAGRHEEAKAPVQDVLDSDPIRGESDAAKVLAGRIAAVEGDTDKAMALWHEVDASPLSSLARAEAGYALVLADLQIGKINRRDAIQDLDRLRFSWRGDDFEVRMLRKLGELQIEDGDYRDGFGALRKVATDFADSA